MVSFSSIRVEVPEGMNVIIGQSHFIKTVSDLYEVLVASSPNLKFGLAFSEASSDCLVRHEGNDPDLEKRAVYTAVALACGHVFVIFLKDGFPISVLNAIKLCQEVCHIFCATANPLEIVVASSEQGNGIMGVIDGFRPKGVEDEAGKAWRLDLLRKFGYKL
jgi:adenosine/AMP kinase